MKFDEKFHFRKKQNWLIEIYKRIDNYCLNIREGVTKEFRQTYIRWSFSGKMFCRVFLYRASIKIYLPLKYSELENPPVFVRDYTNYARFIATEIWLADKEEYLQNEETYFSIISSLIKKSFLETIVEKKLKPVTEREEAPIKLIERFRPLSVNISVDDDKNITVSFRIRKSQKELLNRILQETIFK